jgi:predicted amidohydrolase YtcJ
LIPGLHDHHIHLLALAARRQSVPAGPPAVRTPTELAAALRTADRRAAAGAWLRAVGYHESVAGPLDAAWLDAVVPDRPVRVQHRSGAAWLLNSAGRRATGRPEAGWIHGDDAWLRERVPPPPLDLAATATALAACGVTGVTDATPVEGRHDLDLVAAAAGHPDFPLRVMVTGGLRLPDDAAPTLPRGPVKIVVADHSLPALDELAAAFASAHRRGRPVAVHCVTLEALLLALAAWDEAGATPGDRVEHGAVIPPDALVRLADHGLTVVTQPSFVRDRGDTYLADVDGRDVPDLWRCASLRAAGVAVAGSTDAPFGDPDPWRAVAAAVERRTTTGRALGPDEALAAPDALGLFLAPLEAPGAGPRRLRRGGRADLCLLDAPLDEVLAAPGARHVVATVAAGVVTHTR